MTANAEMLVRLPDYYGTNHARLRNELLASLPAAPSKAGAARDTAPAKSPRINSYMIIGAGLAAAVFLAILAQALDRPKPVIAESSAAQLPETGTVNPQEVKLTGIFETTPQTEWVYTHNEAGLAEWLSYRPNRVFRKENFAVQVFDVEARQHWYYSIGSNVVAVTDWIPTDYFKFDSALSRALLTVEAQEKKGVLSVSREERLVDGQRQQIITTTRKDGAVMKYVIDLEKKRIIRTESLLPQAQTQDRKPYVLTYEYPDSGPKDIFALGVPPDTKIFKSDLPEILEKVRQANENFAKSYVAAHVDINHEPDYAALAVVYVKNGRYRINQWTSSKDLLDIVADPAAGLKEMLSWGQEHPFRLVEFGPIDGIPRGIAFDSTEIQCKKPGELLKRRRGQGARNYLLENIFRPNNFGMSAYRIPDRTGPFGQLIGIEDLRQGFIRDDDVQRPRRVQYWINPERDWLMEYQETVRDTNAPWQKDTNWNNGKSATDNESAFFSRRIEEYGKTADGHWYPARVEEVSRQSEEYQERAEEEKRITKFIYIDANIDISDDYMKEESVTPDQFDQKLAEQQARVQAAIDKIDSQTDWPETPEAVARAYLDAGEAGDKERLALYCVSDYLKPLDSVAPKGYKFALGKTSRYPELNPTQVSFELIQIAPARVAVEHSIMLMNSGSKKGRFYVSHGPY